MAVITLEQQLDTIFQDGVSIITSVSKVLSLTGICPPYPPEAMRYVEHAAMLGKGVHERCERLDWELEDQDSIEALRNSEILPYVTAYQKFREVMKPEWEHIEQRFSREGCVGVPDRIGKIETKTGARIPVIVDLKTSKKLAAHWPIQLTAYKWLSGFDGMLMVVWLKSSGQWELVNYAEALSTWQGALAVCKWILLTGDGAVAKKRKT